MNRRGGHQSFYSYNSPNHHGSSGDEGFRSPRPQFQSSPRVHQHGHGQQAFHGGYHPGMSPISQSPSEQSRIRHASMPSPSLNLSPNYRGRGGRGRYRSGGHQSPRYSQEMNPGGSDDISQYFHPSMLEDPWEKLQPPSNPVPATT